jgi:hypothetical protein
MKAPKNSEDAVETPLCKRLVWTFVCYQYPLIVSNVLEEPSQIVLGEEPLLPLRDRHRSLRTADSLVEVLSNIIDDKGWEGSRHTIKHNVMSSKVHISDSEPLQLGDGDL